MMSYHHLHLQIVTDDNGERRTKCLGKGKGREYDPMDSLSSKVLQDYYRLYNESLLKLLTRFGYDIPQWLQDDLRDDSPAAAHQQEEDAVAALVED